jgi:hypothetical protein
VLQRWKESKNEENARAEKGRIAQTLDSGCPTREDKDFPLSSIGDHFGCARIQQAQSKREASGGGGNQENQEN